MRFEFVEVHNTGKIITQYETMENIYRQLDFVLEEYRYYGYTVREYSEVDSCLYAEAWNETHHVKWLVY